MTSEKILLPILQNLQDGQSDIKKGVVNLRADMNMQLVAVNKKLSGQLISELEFRHELTELRKRLQSVERRRDLRSD